MTDAAHAELLDHEIFQKPFEVKLTFENWDTPEDYRRFPGGDQLPSKMKVWRVQWTEKTYGGVVTRAYNFNDFPDDELLVKGFNIGKEYGAAGVGRHGNFLQWGYSAPPSEMTEAGQKLFLNCIHYIRRFHGKLPLVHPSDSPRMDAVRCAALINKIEDHGFLRQFPPDLLEKYKQNPDGLVQYYMDHLELVYREIWFRGPFQIDDDLRSLGIESNRQISTLEKLIELLDHPQHGQVAESLLKRYTDQSEMTKIEWQKWLEEHRGRIYFSDLGGYKFLVVPEGYLDIPAGNP